MEDNSITEILSKVSAEKFRRKLLISTRILAFLLILAIVWIGFVQIKYTKDVNEIKNKYGSLGYCFMCGLETYRVCSCQFMTDLQKQYGQLDYDRIGNDTAYRNVLDCPLLYKNYTAPTLNFLINETK
jgi:hypothetical protein